MGEFIEFATKKSVKICRAVNKYKMNLNKKKEYKNFKQRTTDFRQSINFIKEWSVHLPALTSVRLDLNSWSPNHLNDLFELEPTIFQNMINLEILHLSSNSIRSLDPKIFSCNKRLKSLTIDCEMTNLNKGIFDGLHSLNYLNIADNRITDLPPNLFKDLVNLDSLVLTENQIKVIPEGLFQNLVNLDYLSLFGNKIDLSDQSLNIFQGLVKLRVLFLAQNRIEHIPEGLFRNLHNLKGIDFSQNRISFFPEGFFRDLKNLKFLQIDDNENEDPSKSIPSNITICEDEIYDRLEDKDE